MNPGPELPPRVGLGLLARAAIAALVIVLVTASSVAAAVILQADSFGCELFGGCEGGDPDRGLRIPEVSRADAGDPRTLLVIGSDKRYGDRGKGNSDTLLLVRLNPDEPAITVTSVPRDLKVTVPGRGRQKVNAAYAIGGERLTVRTLTGLLSEPGEPFEINHVVNVNFGGFRRAVDYIGGVYVDVDRSYYNDNDPPTDAKDPYATIDVPSGYQLLKGRDALDYVRYRHTDNDFVRASRQQDFLRQLKSQPGARKLLDVGERTRLARVFRRYIRVDRSLRDTQQLFSVLKLAIFSRNKPVRQVPFRASESGEYVVASERQLAETRSDFLDPQVAGGESAPRKAKPFKPRRRGARRRSGSTAKVPPGLTRDARSGEDMAIVSARRTGVPFYFPTLRHQSAAYEDRDGAPRVYSIRDEQGRRRRAYRIVAVKDRITGQHYGVQGTTWREPPILASPSEIRSVGGRKLLLFYDGRKLRLVGWKTARGAYWVSNTLTNSLSNPQMLAIAGSLRRLR